MKRSHVLAVFVLFIILCISAAYWAMQLFKPPVRPVTAPPVSRAEASPDAAAGLFGGRPAGTAIASNFELRGVVVSGTSKESIAILSADGKPAQAMRVNMEIVPGTRIKEVHPQYVLLTEGGVTKRVDLPESTKGLGGVGVVNNTRTPIPVPGAATMPAPVIGGQINPQTGNSPVVVNGMPNYNPQAQPQSQGQGQGQQQGQPPMYANDQAQMNDQPPPNGQPQIYHPPNMDPANQANMNQEQTQSHSAAANMPTEAPNAEVPGADMQNPGVRPGFPGGQTGINTR